MSFGLLYWILMLLWLVFGVWSAWPIDRSRFGIVGGTLVLFILLALLGWRVFGAALHE